MRPEDQHYVPAGYLRSFCPDGESALHVCRCRERRWFRQVPENIATRKNFYSILRDGKLDDTVEHVLAKRIETPCLASLLRLKKGENSPSWHTREAISTLLAVQYTRGAEIRDNMHRLMDYVANAFTGEILNDENWMTGHLMETESIPL